ncbi:aldehyde dehydrogenase family protein [Xanthobacter autotrophicus DSM 431]|uniref:aldehyde dehydrogenase family protein n=1 Tax=Xanthobacter nonsaccharivorans TaxID=3119912 RepID=UPI00372BC099
MQPYRNLIGGEWVGTSGVMNINPSDTGDVVGEFARATEADTLDAIAAARAAFPAWSSTTPATRGTILRSASTLLMARREELGTQLSREEGKTLAEGIGEVTRAAQIFDFFAAETQRLAGESLASVRPGIEVTVTREPLGVVGIITPWNFPMAIPAWKIAPALCHGNAVVFKPAELVPASAWSLVSVLQESGLPAGVLNFVNGPGSVVGNTLVNDPRVDGISFTGSVATGQRIVVAAASRFGKVQLEMGGKNPLVVLDDADLDIAVDCAVNGAYFSTGQRCTASSRLIVTRGIHDRFVDALIRRLEQLTVGHALHEGTEVGPVVNDSQLASNLTYIDVGKAEGAHLAFGGEVLERLTPGYFMVPALFTGATNDMRIAREEIFGPVACVIEARDFEEALHLANDTEYGLASGICTTSLKMASVYRQKAQAGMVMVNLPTAGVDFHVPFGGRKRSSYGPREQGRAAAEFYTSIKTAYTLP